MTKKILATITSLSLCLSLLTTLSPVLACETSDDLSTAERIVLCGVKPEETEQDDDSFGAGDIP